MGILFSGLPITAKNIFQWLLMSTEHCFSAWKEYESLNNLLSNTRWFIFFSKTHICQGIIIRIECCLLIVKDETILVFHPSISLFWHIFDCDVEALPTQKISGKSHYCLVIQTTFNSAASLSIILLTIVCVYRIVT